MRNPKHVFTRFLLIALLVGANSTIADQPLSAHVHGNASLEIAVENGTVELLFSSPAMNLIGFEHAPRTEAQRKKNEEALAWFERNALVVIDGCTIAETHAQSSTNRAQGHNGEVGSNEEKSQHTHEHEHEHEHERSDDPTTSRHSEVVVSQTLTCSTSPKGKRAEALLLQRFSGIAELAVAWITGTSQGGERLRPENREFILD